jgi:hypothetical protein
MATGRPHFLPVREPGTAASRDAVFSVGQAGRTRCDSWNSDRLQLTPPLSWLRNDTLKQQPAQRAPGSTTLVATPEVPALRQRTPAMTGSNWFMTAAVVLLLGTGNLLATAHAAALSDGVPDRSGIIIEINAMTAK